VTQDGLPLIGRVPQIEGVYVATGHNVWGILNAFFHFGHPHERWRIDS
jgi:hypothetical protein